MGISAITNKSICSTSSCKKQKFTVDKKKENLKKNHGYHNDVLITRHASLTVREKWRVAFRFVIINSDATSSQESKLHFLHFSPLSYDILQFPRADA